MKFNPVDVWLEKVAKRHSGSKMTRILYQAQFSRFCTFIEQSPERILESWDTAKFDLAKREQFIEDMLQKVDFYESYLGKAGLARTTIAAHLGALQSFFKHMRIPVPVQGFNADPVFHNRDITKEEIKRILNNSTPRDRAYFLMMLQSGLRPVTLVQLRYEQLKQDFESGKHPSVLINVSKEITKGEYTDHITFIGPDAVKALQDYFNERGKPADSEVIFRESERAKRHGAQGLQTNKFSMRFKYHVEHLGLIKERRPKGQPQQLRLYCLRKYFRRWAAPAGPDFVNFWMGHTLGVDDHYFSKDTEFQRKQYEEKAMPGLQIYEPSPLEYTGELRDLRQQLEEQNKVIEKLQNQVNDLSRVAERQHILATMSPSARMDMSKEEIDQIIDANRRMIKKLEQHGLVVDK